MQQKITILPNVSVVRTPNDIYEIGENGKPFLHAKYQKYHVLFDGRSIQDLGIKKVIGMFIGREGSGLKRLADEVRAAISKLCPTLGQMCRSCQIWVGAVDSNIAFYPFACETAEEAVESIDVKIPVLLERITAVVKDVVYARLANIYSDKMVQKEINQAMARKQIEDATCDMEDALLDMSAFEAIDDAFERMEDDLVCIDMYLEEAREWGDYYHIALMS